MKEQALNRREPRQARSQHKVELILELEAAMQLLEDGEINALTMNECLGGESRRQHRGTLYQYFDSKHALLDALVARETMADKIVDSVKRETPASPGERIREIVRAVTAAYGGRNRVHRLLMEHASISTPGGRLAPLYAQLIELHRRRGSGSGRRHAQTHLGGRLCFDLRHCRACCAR